MIDVKGLTKVYGHTTAVNNVSFSAEKGEILGFLGPNGAGKTTTMRMLTCFLPPTSGTARVAGFDILDDPIDVRRRIGYLPENVPLYRDLSVTDYLDFVGSLKGLSRGARRQGTERVMADCGITDVAYKQIGQLSRGYRQRVGLAQALINDPEVLILDEPTVGLDPRQIIDIRELIKSLAGERTVILSTHILPEVSLICQRVIIINDGHLITDDAPDNLRRRVKKTGVVDVVVRGDNAVATSVLESVDGVNTVTPLHIDGDAATIRVDTDSTRDVRDSIAAAVVGAGMGLLELTARDPSLEDIFVHLVTDEVTADE